MLLISEMNLGALPKIENKKKSSVFLHPIKKNTLTDLYTTLKVVLVVTTFINHRIHIS